MEFYKDVVTDKEREMLEKVYQNEEPIRPNLVEFIKILDMSQGERGKESPIYHFFNPILTDEMLEVLLHFELRKMKYIDELAKECNQSIEYTAQMVQKMAHLGILEYYPDKDGVDRVFVPQLCVGSLEWIMGGDTFDQHPEESVLFKQYTFETFTGNGTMLPMSNHGVHRAVPIESALTSDVKRMDWEELSKLIEKNANNTYAVVKCICRRSMEAMETSVGEPSLYWCVAIGHFAEYCIREEKAKPLTKDEFINLLKKAEDRGFVHNVANCNGAGEIEYICNCDYRSCFTLRSDLYSSNSSLTRSNFTAQVNPENCVACGECVETCPMNAVKMGQRLDTKEGCKYYHYQETPHDFLKWGPEHHHPNYSFERKEVWEETGTAPCKTNCPAHIGVEGYLRLAAQGKYDEALALIKRHNPLPAVCGAICNRRCETACTRGSIDQPVAIDEVKKFLAFRELKKEDRYIPEKEETWSEGAKIAVIGSGPAGLAAAYYLQVKGDNVTVFEKNQELGGMLKYGIPSFRLEKEIIDAEIEVIKELGAEFRTGVEVGKDITLDELREQGYKAFFLAIGLQGGRALGVKGEDAEGVISGVQFMRDTIKNGKGDCKGKVVVVGGGNVAVDVARTAVRSGAESVKMFCLETRDIMPAAVDEVEEAESENIEVNCGWGPKEILTENGKVKGIIFKKCTSVKDPDGRFNPQYDEEDTILVEAESILTSIGQGAEWGELLQNSKIELNRNMTVKADAFTLQTGEEDVFAGGDICTGARFAIDAIAAGKEAAESLHRYAWGGHLTISRNRNVYSEIDKDNVEYGSYDNAGREIPKHDHSKKLTFEDDREVFTEEQVKKECERCLRCGASHVDENMCIGCGVCTTRCKFDAIHLRRVFEERPAVREDLVPSVMNEVKRRTIFAQTSEHKPAVAKVESTLNPEISNAVGAIYCAVGSNPEEDEVKFAAAKKHDSEIVDKTPFN